MLLVIAATTCATALMLVFSGTDIADLSYRLHVQLPQPAPMALGATVIVAILLIVLGRAGVRVSGGAVLFTCLIVAGIAVWAEVDWPRTIAATPYPNTYSFGALTILAPVLLLGAALVGIVTTFVYLAATWRRHRSEDQPNKGIEQSASR